MSLKDEQSGFCSVFRQAFGQEDWQKELSMGTNPYNEKVFLN